MIPTGTPHSRADSRWGDRRARLLGPGPTAAWGLTKKTRRHELDHPRQPVPGFLTTAGQLAGHVGEAPLPAPVTAVVAGPSPVGPSPKRRRKRRNPLQFLCDCVVSSYTTIVAAVVAIIDESGKISSALGRYEDKSLTRSKHHPRMPKPEDGRRGSPAIYTLVTVGWFGVMSTRTRSTTPRPPSRPPRAERGLPWHTSS